MADTTTPVLGLVKPEINGAQTENVWGFDINANFDKIDARFGTSIPVDAPLDGFTYGRHLGAWEAVAPLYSPALTGTPTAPTPLPGDNDTSIATTAFVTTALVAAGAVVPSNALPLAPGTPDAGTSELYSRGDHVHPVDPATYTKAAADSKFVDVTGDTMTGPLVTPKGSKFGSAAGTSASGSVTQADANILLYDNAGQNWAGMGTDTAGQFWLRTGTSGTHAPQFWIDTAGKANFTNQTASTSPTTGALTVAGGVGIGGRLNVGSFAQINGGSTTCALSVKADASALGIDLLGRSLDNLSQIRWLENTGGSLYATLQANANGLNFSSGKIKIADTTASTSPTTGALTVAGGVGVGGQLYVGSNPHGTNFCAQSISYAAGGSQYGLLIRPAVDTFGYAVSFLNAAGTSVGNIFTNATVTAYNTSSSAELKEDLQSFDAGNIVDNTEVYDFKWKDTSERAYGIIAQQAVEVYPQAITHDEEQDWWGVDYSKYVPVILQELKALRARVAELEGKPIAPKKGH